MKVKFSKLFTAVASLSTAFVSSMNFCFAMKNHPLDINRYTYLRNHVRVFEDMEEMHNEPALKGKIKLLDITEDACVEKELFDVEVPSYKMKDFHDSDCLWKCPGDNCTCSMKRDFGGLDVSKFLVGSCAKSYVKNVEDLNEEEKNAYRDSLVKVIFTNPKDLFCWTIGGYENDLPSDNGSLASDDDENLEKYFKFVKIGTCSHSEGIAGAELPAEDFDGHVYLLFIEPTEGEGKDDILFWEDMVTGAVKNARQAIKNFKMLKLDTKLEYIFT